MASFVMDASTTLPWCFLEITNGLLSAQRRGRVTAEQVEQFLEQLLRFRIQVEPLTTPQEVRDIRQLAQTYQLTAYDAAYLALALRYQLPLATLDKELIAAASAAGVRLIQ